MKRNWILLAMLLLSACSAKGSVPGDGVFARIETNRGIILVRLEFEKTPLTVMSFVGLAEGRFDLPKAKAGQPYFDGLSFHRMEPGFVIQGGDPNGNGSGGPGYQFPNEIEPSLNHDSEGVLSMANAGPDTNGSQFFITLAPASFLNGNYSVFGQVVEGIEVVKKIQQGDVMQKVRIIREGAAAEAFQPTWQQFQKLSQKLANDRAAIVTQQAKKTKEILLDFAQKQWNDILFSEDEKGLLSHIVEAGSSQTGAQLGDVKQYKIHYTLWAPAMNEGGSSQVNKADSSFDRGEPIEIAPNQVIAAWSMTMPQMRLGEKRIILVPSELGYGSRGSPPVIAPNSYLLFEMQLLDFVR